MTLPLRPPRVHRGSALPPGVPPPKKGELHLRVEGFDWQNTAFEARPPACCSLLISWWGQASYNSLLMPLTASLAFSPATAVFSVHSGAKRFERYLLDMGFLELTLVNGKTTLDLKDVSRTMLGKLSISISSLAEGHPVSGSYPIFANGHRLIGSLTVSITITFYNRAADEHVGQSAVKSNRCRIAPILENDTPHVISSFERNEELASMENTLPLYPLTSFADPRWKPNVSSSNSDRSSRSQLLDREVKLAERSLKGLKSSVFNKTVQKIVNERLSRTESSLSSDSEMTLSPVPDVDSSPPPQDNETNEAHFRPANPFLDPSFCELDGLEAERAESLCGSDESTLSCVISKSARLMKSLACESAGHIRGKSGNLSFDEMAVKDSSLLQDLSKKGCHVTMNSILDKDRDLSAKLRKETLKVGRLDEYASVRKRLARGNTYAQDYGKKSSDLSTSERIKSLRDIPKDSAIEVLKGLEGGNPQHSLRAPQGIQLCTDEAQRGGLSDLLLPSTSEVPLSTCYTNNLFENPASTTNSNIWRREEEQVADKVMPKVVAPFERNVSYPLRPVTSGTQPPLIPKVDFGFDPGGKWNSSVSSVSTFAQTKTTNLARLLTGDRTDPSESCNLKGRSCFSMQQPVRPTGGIGNEPGNRHLCSPCSSPQTVIENIKQLIKRAEACRDTLKKPEFPKTRLMASSPIPSVESIRLSRSHSGHSFGLNSSSDDLLANILSGNDKGNNGEQLAPKVQKHVEDLDLGDDIDDATDVMTVALLEALYVDNDKTGNVSSAAAVEPASFKARRHKSQTGRIEGYWHDDYLQSLDDGLKNPTCWSDEDTLNAPKRDVTSSVDQISVAFPGSKYDQPFRLRIAIGKLVLCGPMVRDLADCRPSKGPIMQPTCTCSLTVSFPALIPPYSSKQRICISPVSFGTREAVFDHQAQLSWNTLPGHDLSDWKSQDLRVAVLLSWQRFDSLECAGYVSLEKVVTSMPGVYRTSLALVLASHLVHKRSRSRSPSKGRSPKRSGKQTLKPGTTSKRNGAQNSDRLASAQKNAVARVDVMLQLCHRNPFPANKHEPFEETHIIEIKRPSTRNEMKPSPQRMLTNSAPVRGNSQDWWLHVMVYDVVNCFGSVLSSPEYRYSSTMKTRHPRLLLAVKLGPELIVQVPFPMKLGFHNQIQAGNSTGGLLPAPSQLLTTCKAVMFIEVWHDAGLVNGVGATGTQKPPDSLVGLTQAPLTLTPTDCCRICSTGPEVVAEGLHQLFDPRRCTTVGTVLVVVTLGSSQQIQSLWKANRAATLIQRRVREFLTRELGPDKSIEITRFWATAGNRGGA